jgi:hypothetical protein
MSRLWATAIAAAGLCLLTGWTLHRGDGLIRTAAVEVSGRDVLDEARVPAIDVRGLEGAIGRENVIVRWTGVWHVPATGVFDLVIESRGRSSWTIDDQLVYEAATADESGKPRSVWLEQGFHPITIKYEPEPGPGRISVAAAPAGHAPAALEPSALKPRLPRNPGLRNTTILVYWLALLAWPIALVLAIRRTIPAVAPWWRQHVEPRWARVNKIAALIGLTAIIGYGGLLRLDAITAQYGLVTSPHWLSALQTRVWLSPESIRPDGYQWSPSPVFPHAEGPPSLYRSDPYTYLEFARQKPSFYAATFREPIFPFTTRVFLFLLNDQDVAVSFTSMAFSLLAIWFTYLLGAATWSRGVGLIAAFGLAVDYDAVSLASAGWRDDAFVAVVALCGFVIVRCWRRGREQPRFVQLGSARVDAAYLDAAAFGVAAGLACLVRLFAASFVIPSAALLFFTLSGGWRRRFRVAGVALGLTLLVAGPYYVNCWRAFGDPFYTFSVHGNIYRVAEGQQESGGSTSDYIRNKFATRPLEMLDTIALGLTDYPFSNKWQGLDHWRRGLSAWARAAGLAGLVVLATSASGRVMLFVLLLSVAPFSFTWRVDPTWRFTAHAYPFLLTAAGAAVSAAWWCLRALVNPRTGFRPDWSGRWRRTAFVWVAAAFVGAVAWWFGTRGSPVLVFAETLRAKADAEFNAGARDRAFFGEGWSDVVGEGRVRFRVAKGIGVVSFPLPEVDDYTVTLRADPFPRPLHDQPGPLPLMELELNGTSIGSVPLHWNADRVGAYDLTLPRAAVRRGQNNLRLQVPRTDAIALWYVRVHPPVPRIARPHP